MRDWVVVAAGFCWLVVRERTSLPVSGHHSVHILNTAICVDSEEDVFCIGWGGVVLVRSGNVARRSSLKLDVRAIIMSVKRCVEDSV